MDYLEIKEKLKNLSQKDYKNLIKAIIAFECNYENEKLLDEAYDYYMENDGVRLLSDEIYGFINSN